MSANPTGIFNYSQLNDKDKAYIVKLSGILISAISMGIFSGLNYDPMGDGNIDGVAIGRLGFFVLLVMMLALSQFIKMKFNLSDMTNMQIFRHGIFVGFLSYLFFWTMIFNFFLFA